jgi:cytochrome P450 RapN
VSDPVPYPFVDDSGLDVSPQYLELHRQGPIKVQLRYGEPVWLATRYEDVRLVHVDRRATKELGLGRDTPRVRPVVATDPSLLACMDPPRHTRVRKLASSAFALPKIRAMHGWIEGLVDELLDDWSAAGPGADFADVAWTLPNLVVTGILGVPRADGPTFRGWIDTMLANDTPMEERAAARQALRGYILELVEARRISPTDDVLGALVHARDEDDRFTEDELVMLFESLFLGGFETTVAQMGSMFFALLSQPDRWQELVDDRSLLPAAMEELWRWVPSGRYGVPNIRWASEDIELSGGVVVPAGEPMLPERVLANRDESVFPNAQDIDFHRTDPAPHLALGFGSHHCVGAHVANLELLLVLEEMLDRFPTLELAVAPSEVRWSPTTFMRSVESLPLTW